MTAKIDAYIIKGEVLDGIQGKVGLKAEYTTLHELSSPQFQITIFGYTPRKIRLYNSLMDHKIASMRKAMKRNGIY